MPPSVLAMLPAAPQKGDPDETWDERTKSGDNDEKEQREAQNSHTTLIGSVHGFLKDRQGAGTQLSQGL
jgi:hypothetical protein